MTVVTLVPKDSRKNHWIFWFEDQKGMLRIRPEVADLVCPSCGKVDEVEALSRGLPAGARIDSRRDFLGLNDGFIAVSDRFRTVCDEQHIEGLRFVAAPDGAHHVVLPGVRVETDMSLAGFQFVPPKCASCERYREAVVGPLVRSMSIPANPLTVFASEAWNENVRGRVLRLFAQREGARALRDAKLSGLAIEKAR